MAFSVIPSCPRITRKDAILCNTPMSEKYAPEVAALISPEGWRLKITESAIEARTPIQKAANGGTVNRGLAR